jgi:hypothetical protein
VDDTIESIRCNQIESVREVDQIPQIDVFHRHGTGRLACDFALALWARARLDD